MKGEGQIWQWHHTPNTQKLQRSRVFLSINTDPPISSLSCAWQLTQHSGWETFSWSAADKMRAWWHQASVVTTRTVKRTHKLLTRTLKHADMQSSTQPLSKVRVDTWLMASHQVLIYATYAHAHCPTSSRLHISCFAADLVDCPLFNPKKAVLKLELKQ